jgi:hypothetical protein
MNRSCLLLSWCALVLCAGQEADRAEANPNESPVAKATSHRSRLVPARYFVDPANRHVDIQSIREHTDRTVTISGHYSQSAVGCGTGCMSFWIVDRRTGAIIEAPPSSREIEIVDDVRGRMDSDIVEIIYGRRDGVGNCRARNYRLRGTRFTVLGGYFPTPCPGPG